MVLLELPTDPVVSVVGILTLFVSVASVAEDVFYGDSSTEDMKQRPSAYVTCV